MKATPPIPHPPRGPVEWKVIENKLVVEESGLVEDITSGVGTLLNVESAGKFGVSSQSSPTFSAQGISFYTGNTGASDVVIDGGVYDIHHDPGIGSVKLSIVSEGTMSVHSRRGAMARQAGHGFLLRPGENRTVEFSDGARVLIIETSKEILEGYNNGAFGADPLQFGPAGTLSESILAFGTSVAHHHPAGPLNNYFIDQFLQEMVASIVLSVRGVSESERRGRSGAFSQSQYLINGRYIDPSFSVTELASLLKMSVRNLQDIYAQQGKNVSQAIRDRRLQEAKRLLSDPMYVNLTVEEVATYSGFDNTQRLRRAFETADLPNPRAFRAQAMRAGRAPE